MVKNRRNHTGKKIPLGLLLATLLAVAGWVEIGKAWPLPVAAPGMQAASAAKAQAAAKQPSQAQAPRPLRIEGRRDPFKLPPPPGPGGPEEEGITGPLPPGKRGLVIGRLRLEGIVRLDTTNEMIAVVDTRANRAYFLREGDAVFNGVVSKITPDSVYFQENVLDQQGRVRTREVVKRLS